jgi:hypothetical protein
VVASPQIKNSKSLNKKNIPHDHYASLTEFCKPTCWHVGYIFPCTVKAWKVENANFGEILSDLP